MRIKFEKIKKNNNYGFRYEIEIIFFYKKLRIKI
jgi:hypothetical protein